MASTNGRGKRPRVRVSLRLFSFWRSWRGTLCATEDTMGRRRLETLCERAVQRHRAEVDRQLQSSNQYLQRRQAAMEATPASQRAPCYVPAQVPSQHVAKGYRKRAEEAFDASINRVFQAMLLDQVQVEVRGGPAAPRPNAPHFPHSSSILVLSRPRNAGPNARRQGACRTDAFAAAPGPRWAKCAKQYCARRRPCWALRAPERGCGVKRGCGVPALPPAGPRPDSLCANARPSLQCRGWTSPRQGLGTAHRRAAHQRHQRSLQCSEDVEGQREPGRGGRTG